jgi:hypothetical protein
LWGRFECYLLEILHDEVGYDRGEWRTHGHTISLSVELPIECEVGSGQNMAESARVFSSKWCPNRSMVSFTGTLVWFL